MKSNNYKWALTVTIIAFILSIIMSLISNIVLRNVTLFISILVTFLFILFGILFDIIGVAVTVGDEVVFHSMSSQKIRGGKIGVKLIKNKSKVSSVCCDVVVDICGIISGSAGVTIISLLINLTNINGLLISLIVAALISSLTIGGKALGKNIAVNKSNQVVKVVAVLLSIFEKK